MRGTIDDSTTITPKGERRYELHLSPELHERFISFFENQTFHPTPSDLLTVVVRNGIKVLERRKAKSARRTGLNLKGEAE